MENIKQILVNKNKFMTAYIKDTLPKAIYLDIICDLLLMEMVEAVGRRVSLLERRDETTQMLGPTLYLNVFAGFDNNTVNNIITSLVRRNKD